MVKHGALLAALFGAAAASSVAYAPQINGRFLEEIDAAGDMASGDPPSSPPPPPAAVLEMAFEANGDLSDYTSAVQDGIKAAYASAAGVSVDAVNVAVTAGSVLVTVTITTPDATAADAVSTALSSSTSTAAEVTTLLSSVPGISISVSTITSALALVSSPPPPSNPSSGLSAGAIVGIVIGSVVGCMILSFICFKAFKNFADSPSAAPLIYSQKRNDKYGSGAAGTVEITKQGAVDVI